LVPGSGPSLCGNRWVPCRYTQQTRRKPSKPFLVDYQELSRCFRDRYVRGIKRLIKAGKLQIDDPQAVEQLLGEVQACEWVVYIQPPPNASSDPADIVKYLARYMTGGPISDKRLIEVKAGRVYFLARADDKSGRQVKVSLNTTEFVRSWTLHILPKGFTKVRSYGGWSNRRREQYQQQCAQLQPAPATTPTVPAEPPQEPQAEEVRKCPKCDAAMELESNERRPRWRELFYGPDHPQWMEWTGSG
jgi:hypothetical protein